MYYTRHCDTASISQRVSAVDYSRRAPHDLRKHSEAFTTSRSSSVPSLASSSGTSRSARRSPCMPECFPVHMQWLGSLFINQIGRECDAYLHPLRERRETRELAEPPLADSIPVLVTIPLNLRLAWDGQNAVVDVVRHVLPVNTGQFESCSHDVLLRVLVQVDPEGQWSV